VSQRTRNRKTKSEKPVLNGPDLIELCYLIIELVLTLFFVVVASCGSSNVSAARTAGRHSLVARLKSRSARRDRRFPVAAHSPAASAPGLYPLT